MSKTKRLVIKWLLVSSVMTLSTLSFSQVERFPDFWFIFGLLGSILLYQTWDIIKIKVK